jgi:hypothetical protein
MPHRIVPINTVRAVIKEFNIDEKVLPAKTLQKWAKIELEHGTMYKKTNITNDNPRMTLMITLAHLMEFPDYYPRLIKMEHEAESYWKGKKKPQIFKGKKGGNGAVLLFST